MSIFKARTLTLLTILVLLAGPGLLLPMPSFLISRWRVLECCSGAAPSRKKLFRPGGPLGNVSSTCKCENIQSLILWSHICSQCVATGIQVLLSNKNAYLGQRPLLQHP